MVIAGAHDGSFWGGLVRGGIIANNGIFVQYFCEHLGIFFWGVQGEVVRGRAVCSPADDFDRHPNAG